MERKSSPWTTGLVVAGLLAALLVGYVGAYWWRLSAVVSVATATTPQGPQLWVEFPTTAETRLFQPLCWIHSRAHIQSFKSRLRMP